jgi:hypothetical protein
VKRKRTGRKDKSHPIPAPRAEGGETAYQDRPKHKVSNTTRQENPPRSLRKGGVALVIDCFTGAKGEKWDKASDRRVRLPCSILRGKTGEAALRLWIEGTKRSVVTKSSPADGS